MRDRFEAKMERMMGSGGEPDGGRRRRKCKGKFRIGMSNSCWLSACDDGGLVSSKLSSIQTLEMHAVIYLSVHCHLSPTSLGIKFYRDRHHLKDL